MKLYCAILINSCWLHFTSQEFCHLLHKYQSCLVDTICRHCVNPKVAGEKHLDKKDEICKTERARLFSICTDSVVKQQNCRWWENFKLALWLLAFLFVYFIPSLFRFCHWLTDNSLVAVSLERSLKCVSLFLICVNKRFVINTQNLKNVILLFNNPAKVCIEQQATSSRVINHWRFTSGT